MSITEEGSLRMTDSGPVIKVFAIAVRCLIPREKIDTLSSCIKKCVVCKGVFLLWDSFFALLKGEKFHPAYSFHTLLYYCIQAIMVPAIEIHR